MSAGGPLQLKFLLLLFALGNIICSLKIETDKRDPDQHLSPPNEGHKNQPAEGRKSLALLQNDTSTSVALCYKTMYGNIDMDRVIRWANYHHLLGFDRIFLWYLPSVAKYDGFDRLKALPYITLLENNNGTVTLVPEKSKPGFPYYRVTGEGGDQAAVEEACLQKYARNFDWVMLSDVDEYLWFKEEFGVKDLIQQYAPDSYMHFLSFGKRQYALSHRLAPETSDYDQDQLGTAFLLERYPFRAGYYCFGYLPQKRGREICPGWKGSSKVLVRPQRHKRVNVHGAIAHYRKGVKHFHPDEAHVKEWHGMHTSASTLQKNATIVRDRKDLSVDVQKDYVSIVNLEMAHRPDENGRFPLYFDSGLARWFQYVASRGL